MRIPPNVSVLRDTIEVEQRQFLTITRAPDRFTPHKAEWSLGLAALNILHHGPIPTSRLFAHAGHLPLHQLYGP